MPKFPAVTAFMADPPRVQESMVAAVNSDVTTTTTILSGCAVPIA